jgi:acyl carrier protein
MALEREKICVEMRAWLQEASLEPEAAAAADERTDLLESGVIDSFGMLDLLTWIDERYGVFIEFGEGDDVLTRIGDLADRVLAEQGAAKAEGVAPGASSAG